MLSVNFKIGPRTKLKTQNKNIVQNWRKCVNMALYFIFFPKGVYIFMADIFPFRIILFVIKKCIILYTDF